MHLLYVFYIFPSMRYSVIIKKKSGAGPLNQERTRQTESRRSGGYNYEEFYGERKGTAEGIL